MGKTNKDNRFEKELKPKKSTRTTVKKTKKETNSQDNDFEEDFLKMGMEDFSFLENDEYYDD